MRFFYITLLILGAMFILPDFVYAADLPSECPGVIDDYTIVDISLSQTASGSNDFIFAGDNNDIVINGGGGSDCILVGNGNTAEISGNGNDDIIIVGDNNSGKIRGKGGNDIIIVGENNIGDISGEGGNDTLVDGYGSTGVINGGGGNDTIVHVPPAPSAEPLSGTFNSTQDVTLSSDGAVSIFYTTDGVVPVCDENEGIGELYESSFLVLSTKTIIAIACAEEGYASPVSSFTYTIELKTDPANLSSVLETVFVPAPGTSVSLTPTLTLSQDLEINTTASGSKIILEEATIITRADDLELNAASLSSSETDIGLLTGLAEGQVFEAALQWGIIGTTLEFSLPITINIFVGIDLNGQTLDVFRSKDGIVWETEGLVDTTCLVTEGICSFQATKASYYVATSGSATPSPTPSSRQSSTGTINVVKVVVNDNGGTKVIYDFPLFINGQSAISGQTYTFPAPGPVFTVTETGDPNYAQAFSGDCDVNGQLNLNPGQNKLCIITNNDIGPSITNLGTPTEVAVPTSSPTPSAVPNVILAQKPKALPKITKISSTIVSTPTPAIENQSVEVVPQQTLQRATILTTISHAIISNVEKIKSIFFRLIGIKTK